MLLCSKTSDAADPILMKATPLFSREAQRIYLLTGEINWIGKVLRASLLTAQNVQRL